MSRLGDDIARGLRGLGKYAGGDTFKWPATGGNNYACIANTASESKELSIGGLALEADLSLFVERAVLPATGPAEKERILFKGKFYRIETIDDLPGSSMLKFICNAATKGV